MIVHPDAQPEILFADASSRRRHRLRGEIALLTRLIRDELSGFAQRSQPDRGRIRGWILAAQAIRRERRRTLARCLAADRVCRDDSPPRSAMA